MPQFVLVLPSLPYYAAATTVRVDILIIMRLLAMRSRGIAQQWTTPWHPGSNRSYRDDDGDDEWRFEMLWSDSLNEDLSAMRPCWLYVQILQTMLGWLDGWVGRWMAG